MTRDQINEAYFFLLTGQLKTLMDYLIRAAMIRVKKCLRRLPEEISKIDVLNVAP